MLRNTRHSTEAGASNLFELFIDIIRALEAVLDVGRHVAVLYAASDGTTTVRTIASSVGSRQLALTNVDVMSATFTASVVLNLRTVWVSGRSRGKVLLGLTTRFSVRVVYDDDGAEHVASSGATHGSAELLARFAPRRFVAGTIGPTGREPRARPPVGPESARLARVCIRGCGSGYRAICGEHGQNGLRVTVRVKESTHQ